VILLFEFGDQLRLFIVLEMSSVKADPWLGEIGGNEKTPISWGVDGRI